MDLRFASPTTEPQMQTKTATEIVAAQNTVEIVDAAVEMNREVARLTKEMDVLKAALRELGVAAIAATSANNVTLTGTIGTAQVACVKASPKAKKGANLLAAKDALPAEVFASLFTVKTVVDFAEDFEAQVAGLTTAQKKVVGGLFEMVAGTSRVTIK